MKAVNQKRFTVFSLSKSEKKDLLEEEIKEPHLQEIYFHLSTFS